MSVKRFLIILFTFFSVAFIGCQIKAVEKTLNGMWTESRKTSSGEQVITTITFIGETATFTWIERTGDVETNNRTGSYIIYLNDDQDNVRLRATVVLTFAETPEEPAKSAAFWFSFSKSEDGTEYLNLEPIDEADDVYVLTRAAEA